MLPPVSDASFWRAFEANEITHSAAHYLLAVDALTRESGPPRAAQVARRLGVSRAAASTQIRSLRTNGWLTQDAGRTLHLTSAATRLVRRISAHRATLVALFHGILGLDPEEAEIQACKMEHLLAPRACAALLRLVRLFRNGHPAALALAAALRDEATACPGLDSCELCSGLCLEDAEGTAQ